jgi:type IV pilus assembly protein PilE
MITVAIIAILSAIALPAYNQYVTRSRITEATSGLSSMRVKMEQFYQDNRTYNGACTNNTIAALPAPTANFTFSCTFTPADGNHYTVVATGTGAGPMSGFVYTIDQNNAQATPNVPAGWVSSANCWVQKKDGSC